MKSGLFFREEWVGLGQAVDDDVAILDSRLRNHGRKSKEVWHDNAFAHTLEQIGDTARIRERIHGGMICGSKLASAFLDIRIGVVFPAVPHRSY